jgi:hypothetical protein
MRRSATVTVRASHIAFADFAIQTPPVVVKHFRHIHPLVGGFPVVKVEYESIRFAAVNARVVTQILREPRSILRKQTQSPFALLFDVKLRTFVVIGFEVSPLALAAMCLHVVKSATTFVEL